LPEDLGAPGGQACKDGVDHDKRTIRAFNGNDFDSSMLESAIQCSRSGPSSPSIVSVSRIAAASMVMLYISASLWFWSRADPIAHSVPARLLWDGDGGEFAGLALPARKFQRRPNHVGGIRQPTHLSGFRNLNSPHKPLPTLVDSARAGAGAYTALRSSGQSPGLARASVAENAVGDLVTDPPAEAMTTERMSAAPSSGAKTAIASTSRRTRMKSLTTMHLGVEAGREAGAGAQLAQFGARIASFRLRAQKRQGDLR
jgi:hypothetical protein